MNERIDVTKEPVSLIHLLSEDELYRAILKPSGVHSVSLSEGDGSVATWLRIHFPEHAGIGSKNDAGLTHRLDLETSGVLIAARSQEAWLHSRELFSRNQVTKWYVALIEGILPAATICTASIATRYRHSKTVTPILPEQAQEPHYRQRFHSIQPARSTFFPLTQIATNGPSLVAVLSETGRRHQIRAHAASLGNPLAGDTKYGAHTHPSVLGERSFLLHSLGISFIGFDGARRTYLSLDTLPAAIATMIEQSWRTIDHDAARFFSLAHPPLLG